MTTRRPIDVVVPFFGTDRALELVARRLREIRLGDADTLVIVDNRPEAPRAERIVGGVRVISAPDRQSSYFARNAGAARGRGEWIVFLDADVEPPEDLIERYFELVPDTGTGLLAGAVIDGPPREGPARGAAARYAVLRSSMTQENTLTEGPWMYAQTASCAVRRAAFEQIGAFRDDVRSGGDADLCFRLRERGWAIERRDAAAVVHRSRPSVRRLIAQRARHGAGARWLEERYPGSSPPPRWLGLGAFAVRGLAAAVRSAATGRRDDALLAYMEPLSAWAFALGRSLPNSTAGGRSGMLSRALERWLVG